MIDLAKVRANFDRRAQRFVYTASLLAGATSTASRDMDQQVSHIIVELESALAYVARCAYLAGSVGGADASGAKLRGTGVDSVAALRAASRAVGKKAVQVPGRDEPSWSSASHVTAAAHAISVSNRGSIISAMGIFPDARKCVKAFRNFYAHRNADTLTEARSVLGTEYGLTWRGHPSPALLRLPSSSGGPLLETWIWNYVDIVHTLC